MHITTVFILVTRQLYNLFGIVSIIEKLMNNQCQRKDIFGWLSCINASSSMPLPTMFYSSLSSCSNTNTTKNYPRKVITTFISINAPPETVHMVIGQWEKMPECWHLLFTKLYFIKRDPSQNPIPLKLSLQNFCGIVFQVCKIQSTKNSFTIFAE